MLQADEVSYFRLQQVDEMLQLETRGDADVTHLEIPVELAVVFSKQQGKLLFRCFVFSLDRKKLPCESCKNL